MQNKKIETTLATFTKSSTDTTFDKDEMKQDILRLWKKEKNERRFVISFFQARHLIEQSNIKQIALKVTDPLSPNIEKIYAEWVTMQADIPSISNMPSTIEKWQELLIKIAGTVPNHFGEDQEEIYFTIGEDVIESFFTGHKKKPYEMVIVGRIGKTATGLITLYLIPARAQLILKPGTGGGGNSAGAKIPRKSKK